MNTYLFSCLSTYIWDLFSTKLVTKVKPNMNAVEVHPELNNNGYLVDGARVGAGSLWRSPHSAYVFLIGDVACCVPASKCMSAFCHNHFPHELEIK